jgi:PAS domain S-box-containing protein
MKLRLKLLIFLAAMSIILGLAMGPLVYWGVSNAIISEVAKRGIALVTENSFKLQLKDALKSRSEKALLPHLNNILSNINAIYVEALLLDGSVIARTNVAEKGGVRDDPELRLAVEGNIPVYKRDVLYGKPVLIITCPVWAEQESDEGEEFLLTGGPGAASRSKAGILRVGISLEEALDTTRRILMLIFAALGGVCLAGIGFIFFFTGRTLKQLDMLIAATAQVGRSGVCADVPVLLADEIGELASGFNKMSRQLATTMVSRDFLNTVLGNMLDALIVADTEGKIQMVNNAMLAMTDFSESEIIGRSYHELLAPGGVSGSVAKLPPSGDTASNIDAVLIARSGEKIPVMAGFSHIHNGGENAGGTIISAKDMRQHKKIQAMLRQSDKLAAVGQLPAGAAHEINKPLGIILGFSQSVTKRLKETDPLTAPLKTIEREAVRCKDLVQNLLVFSRSYKNEQRELMELNSPVDSALALVEAQTKTRSVELIREPGAGLPKIYANKIQIQQLIINLANNAVDAMPEGGTLSVKTSLSLNRPGYVEIQVRDTGIGITPESRQKIFEPFFTTKEVGKGTGLGLSLVHEIVNKHGGAITLESEEGKGTVFIVTLPAQQAAADRETML